MSTNIPQDNNGRLAWSLNFENKFPTLAQGLGFGDEEAKSLIDDSRMMRFLILNSQVSSAFSKTARHLKTKCSAELEKALQRRKFLSISNQLHPQF